MEIDDAVSTLNIGQTRTGLRRIIKPELRIPWINRIIHCELVCDPFGVESGGEVSARQSIETKWGSQNLLSAILSVSRERVEINGRGLVTEVLLEMITFSDSLRFKVLWWNIVAVRVLCDQRVVPVVHAPQCKVINE